MEYKKRAVPQLVRRQVATRYGAAPGESVEAACHYCGAKGLIRWPMLPFSGRPGSWVHFMHLELDHVVPEYKGGSNDDPANFVLACKRCNCSKGHRWPGPRHSLNRSRTNSGSGSLGEGIGRDRKGKDSLPAVDSIQSDRNARARIWL